MGGTEVSPRKDDQMKKLQVKDLILNEKTVVERFINDGNIPEYWNVCLLVRKLMDYFYETGSQDIVTDVCRALEAHGIGFTRQGIEKEVQVFYERIRGMKKQYLLADYKESIKIYKSEVEAIESLDSLCAKRIAFSILMLVKIEFVRLHKKPYEMIYLNKEIGSYFVYANTSVNYKTKIKTLYELQQKGIITVPLIDRGLYCNILAHDGEIAYEITDGFDSSYPHFEKIINAENNRTILEIKVDSGEHFIHHGFLEINKNRKARGDKAVVVNNVRQCCELKRMSINGSYWIEIPEEFEHDMEAINKIKQEIQRIAKVYRKLSKQLGYEQIKIQFNQFMDALQEAS